MRVLIRKWGNGVSVRVPAAVMEAVGLSLGQAVDIREENGRVVVEPIQGPAFSLRDLLSAVTDENIHGEIDFGRPVGKDLP
ncbi:MAG TPA: AbrB/MazE/SpoVT family DNA-binding domain-containing protein [Rhodopila sp.]|jgi:antitoxin MazE|nr:AbrB/MazE/SpoVT family DNA-binding domain-containing protein [Rhodopila sp.]